MSSGYESGGYGLINLDGSTTERAIAAGKTARIITENMDLLLHSKPVAAQIAIVYNPLAQMVGGEQRTVTTDMHLQSLLGYYRFFTEQNIPVDFIHRRDLENDDLSAYRLVIVPYPLMFTQKAADGLKKYVAAGGCVVSEARMAWNDERGFATSVIPGMGLEQIFGGKETSVQMGERVPMIIKTISHPVINDLAPGDTLYGANFAESLELTAAQTGKVLAHFSDGTPCLISNRYGKGETLFIGTFLGMANHQKANAKNEKLLLALSKWAGIQRPFTSNLDGVKETPVEIRMRSVKEGFLLFLINHSERALEVAVNLTVPVNRTYLVTHIIDKQEETSTARGLILPLQVQLPGRDVKVSHIH